MVDYLTFGGVKTSDYDIYISGEGVFSAPKRDVEAVTIPGRDGDFMHDKGRYENITVTYPAFTHQGTYAQFISNIDAFRNAVASKTGYQVLSDTYHPSEYRMACLTEGMEIDPILYNSGAKFDLVFNCKPQRFLTSGDTAVAVADGGTITNPTLFDAKPQLQVWGYGNINVNGYDIIVNNENIGDVMLYPAQDNVQEVEWYAVGGDNRRLFLLNNGDTIYCNTIRGKVKKYFSDFSPKTVQGLSFGTATYTATNMTCDSVSFVKIYLTPNVGYQLNMIINGLSFVRGTDGNLVMKVPMNVTFTDSTSQTVDICLRAKWFIRPGTNPSEVLYFESSVDSGNNYNDQIVEASELRGISTKSALGTPTYIDCDLGESYLIDGDEVVSLDRLIELGSNLPVLSSGSNTITYDNTVTSFKIVPRWWKI